MLKSHLQTIIYCEKIKRISDNSSYVDDYSMSSDYVLRYGVAAAPYFRNSLSVIACNRILNFLHLKIMDEPNINRVTINSVSQAVLAMRSVNVSA